MERVWAADVLVEQNIRNKNRSLPRCTEASQEFDVLFPISRNYPGYKKMSKTHQPAGLPIRSRSRPLLLCMVLANKYT